MESIDVSQPNPTDPLVPQTGQQSDTFASNPLQHPNPDSNQSGSGKDPSLSDEAALNAATWFAKGATRFVCFTSLPRLPFGV